MRSKIESSSFDAQNDNFTLGFKASLRRLHIVSLSLQFTFYVPILISPTWTSLLCSPVDSAQCVVTLFTNTFRLLRPISIAGAFAEKKVKQQQQKISRLELELVSETRCGSHAGVVCASLKRLGSHENWLAFAWKSTFFNWTHKSFNSRAFFASISSPPRSSSSSSSSGMENIVG